MLGLEEAHVEGGHGAEHEAQPDVGDDHREVDEAHTAAVEQPEVGEGPDDLEDRAGHHDAQQSILVRQPTGDEHGDEHAD